MAKIIFFLVCAIISAVSGQLTVTISQGNVLGSLATDGEYVEFYGIPYAESTADGRRFQVSFF